ncbi:MAG: glycosyltransferase family 4 protein [Alphaproteobacteria bacterium]
MPTGVDRVEHAYVRHLLKTDPDRVAFVFRAPSDIIVTVPHNLIRDMFATLDTRRLGEPGWEEASKPAAWLALSAVARLGLLRYTGALARALKSPHETVYLLASHMGADRPETIATLKRKGVKFVPLVHDLIPMSFPEYAPAKGAERHRRRVDAFANLADGIIVNSNATAQELIPHLRQDSDRPPILSAPLGVDMPLPDANYATPSEPYFVYVGTIEPRKNHLLLLNLWRGMVQRLGAEAPTLILVGRRGWENENILDMLDRCPSLSRKVIEYSGLPDNAVAKLLKGARALLFPSFAEGYGLPLAEALSLGVPAICSDLPALREVGRGVPEFLDPLDGMGWQRLILDFAREYSPLREAQLSRLESWSLPTWEHHFSLVDPWLEQIACAPAHLFAPRIPNQSAQLAPLP